MAIGVCFCFLSFLRTLTEYFALFCNRLNSTTVIMKIFENLFWSFPDNIRGSTLEQLMVQSEFQSILNDARQNDQDIAPLLQIRIRNTGDSSLVISEGQEPGGRGTKSSGCGEALFQVHDIVYTHPNNSDV